MTLSINRTPILNVTTSRSLRPAPWVRISDTSPRQDHFGKAPLEVPGRGQVEFAPMLVLVAGGSQA